MTNIEPITLHYAPQTRATGVRVLLEELKAPYRLHVMNMKVGEQRQPAYLAINPLGKVPAISHGKTFVTEQPAIYIYLADLFPQAGLAPAIDSPDRGAYLRWLVFYGSCFEPAMIDRHLQREPASPNETPYSSHDDMLATIEEALKPGPYLLGDKISAADLLWGTALHWTTMFGLVPDRPVFRDYIERMTAREAYEKVTAQDGTLAAEHQFAADALAGAAA